MKNKIIYFASLILLAACHQDNKQTSSTQQDTAEVQKSLVKPAQIAETPWSAKLDTATQKFKMTPSALVQTEDLDPENVCKALNTKYPEIIAQYVKQSTDTLFVKIPDATYLTQSAGNTGAEIYMAEATYSFTQIPGVNFVNFNFEEGDHAAPGTFKRGDFDFK